ASELVNPFPGSVYECEALCITVGYIINFFPNEVQGVFLVDQNRDLVEIVFKVGFLLCIKTQDKAGAPAATTPAHTNAKPIAFRNVLGFHNSANFFRGFCRYSDWCNIVEHP